MNRAAAELLYAGAVVDALAAFPVSVQSVELVTVSENVTWRVTDTSAQRYVLRLHRPGYHTLDELLSERVWIRALEAAGVAVPRGIRARSGAEYVTVEVPATGETRHAGLAHWADGDVLQDLFDAQPGILENAALIEHWFGQLGALIAVLHNQASVWAVPHSFARHALDADGLMGHRPFWGPFWEHPAFEPVERILLATARARLHTELAGLARTPDIYSVIHADLHSGNLLVHGETLAVIDFDDAGFGWHPYDLAVALRPYRTQPWFAPVYDAVLRGYRSQRPLTDAVAALIPKFMLIRRLASVGWLMQRPELRRELQRSDIDVLCQDVRTFLAD